LSDEAIHAADSGRTNETDLANPNLNVMDSGQLLDSLQTASDWLRVHVPSVNALNVFPVPDGDTGTNMSMTMHAALDEVSSESYNSVADLMRVFAHGALMGARGNSGVILSQILRGFAKALDGDVILSGTGLAKALEEGSITAYKGVMKPVEGTILTVVREAAEAAERAVSDSDDIQYVLDAALAEARNSLARTPDLLPVLAAAGVVDAGGQGLVLILEGIVRYLRGESVEITHETEIHVHEAHAPDGDYNYDTQFIIKGTSLDVPAIRGEIATMGDSVLVVGDSNTVKVHVHSDNPGKALDYGISQGEVTEVIIENMQLQYEEFKKASEPSVPIPQPSESAPLTDTSTVAVVAGEGIKRVFESLGVDVVVHGGQTMNPSTQDILRAIESAPCDKVIVLPNNGNIILAARQAQELSSKHVVVVPTKTVPQGIAALMSFNYQADLEANFELMSNATSQVQTIEITRAVRSAQVNGLEIADGQFIGLQNGNLVTVGEDILSVVQELLARIDAADYEIMTIYYGEDIPPDQANELAETIVERYPDLETEVLDGGQAHYHFIISIE